MKILLVDDEERFVNTLRRGLETDGFDVDIALDEMTRVSAGDVRAQPLTWLSRLAAHHLPPEHEGRFAIQDVQDVSLRVVDFHLTGLLAMTAGDEQILQWLHESHCAAGNGRSHAGVHPHGTP